MFKNVLVTFTVLVIFCLVKCNSLTQEIVIVNRIFGGYHVPTKDKFEFKWLVALHNRVNDNFFCAGSLISQQHVLTAAHCFQPKGQLEKLSPQEFLCRIGRFNLGDPNEDGTIDSLVWDVVSNPKWNFNEERFISDIAIVVLQDKIVYTKTYYSVHLPPQRSKVVTSNGTIAGWGKSETSENGRHDNTPSTLEIPVVNITHCMMKSPSLGRFLSHSVFCGGYYKESTNNYYESKGPCTGDSGGGLYVRNGDGNWKVLGIISMSLKDVITGCDTRNFAFYTNVSYFGEWITKVMEDTNEKAWQLLKFECQKTSIKNEEVVNCDSSEISHNARNLIMQVKDESVRAIQNLQVGFDKKSPQIVQGIGKAFTNLRSLTVRSGHSFKSVERSDFMHMTDLERLTLYGNKISVIADDAFDYLAKLKHINLDNCGIRKISSNLFSKLARLQTLSLIQNSLKNIPENAFENLPNLKSLTLTENPIKELSKKLLQNNSNFEKFYCRSCKLDKIGINFALITSIREIYLEGNECIDENFSVHHPDLKTVNTIDALQEMIRGDC